MHGNVYERDNFHNNNCIDDSDATEDDKRDRGRVGNNASVKCNVCNVYLCDNKGRFPKSDKTCWELWYNVTNFNKGLAQTLCHLRNPGEQGWVTVTKQMCLPIGKGGKRGVVQSVVKPPKFRRDHADRMRSANNQ
jgi:hypothetical protein